MFVSPLSRETFINPVTGSGAGSKGVQRHVKSRTNFHKTKWERSQDIRQRHVGICVTFGLEQIDD